MIPFIEVTTVLHGEIIELRLVREVDLNALYESLSNLETRGDFFPTGVMSEPSLRAEFNKNGFWDKEEGMLVMVNDAVEIVGEIEYFPIAQYLQGYELSYQLFGSQHAGKGWPSPDVMDTFILG